MLGLRIRLHKVNCEKHKHAETQFVKSHSLNFDFEVEKQSKIYESLSTLKYMCYSTIFISIDCQCSCRNSILSIIIKAMKNNKYLNNKLKIIFTYYTLLPDYIHIKPWNIWNTNFAGHVYKLADYVQLEENKNSDIYEILNKYMKVAVFQQITSDDSQPLKDYFTFQSDSSENVLLLQEFLPPHLVHCSTLMLTIMSVLATLPFVSAPEMKEFLLEVKSDLGVHIKETENELLFFSINPALAIINNNYIFTNQKPGCSIREGSQMDVIKIIRECKIAQIPYILTEDYSRVQLLNLVRFLSHRNLKALKSLLFITMTHGTSNNIIYTHDGELNFIEDILIPIQDNETLTGSSISFFNVHCRGLLNAQNSDPLEFDQILPTEIPQLKPNVSLMSSVPNMVLSPRDPQIGAPYVGSLCKTLRNLSPTSDIKDLRDQICEDLKNDSYYAYLDCFGHSSELVQGDETKFHCIKPMPTRITEVMPLLEEIKKDFVELNLENEKLDKENINGCYNASEPSSTTAAIESENSSFFCIGANVNEMKFSKNLDQLKYLSPELDKEKCFIEEP